MTESLTIPQSAEALTPRWLTDALRSSGVLVHAVVTAVDCRRIGADEGFTGGLLLRCALTYSAREVGAPRTIVAKMSPSDPQLRAAFAGTNRREVGFYTEAAAAHRLSVPRCYYGAADAATGTSILLLEDLDAYRMVEFATGCTLAEARAVVHALAVIHGRLWNDPSLENLSGPAALDDYPVADLWAQYPTAVSALLPDLALPDRFWAIGEMATANAHAILHRLTDTAPMTLIHADIHVDNILFSTREKDAPAVILDWQSVNRGRGAYDLAYFLISSLEPADRRAWEDELLREYHATLMETGAEAYSLAQCRSDYLLSSVGKLYGTIIATVWLDNSDPFKRAWRRKDLARQIAFFDDHAVDEVLTAAGYG